MNVKISRLPYKLLWNSEYPIFVTQLNGIVQKHNPAALHLSKAYGKVTTRLPEVAKIKAQELSNAISNKLQDLDAERDTLLSAIFAQVKTMGRLNMAAFADNVKVLEHFFDTHGRDIPMANYNAETKRINDLLADYDAKAEVKTAAAALNLAILFEQLRTVNTQFAELFLQRTEEVAAIEKADTRAIRNETDKTLNALFDAIEFCSSEYDELDYTSLANEVNDLVAYYKTQLRARITRRNAGKDVSTEKPIE